MKNDQPGLKVLLASLRKQTRRPDEVIVIDGGQLGINRASGRNLAIKQAQAEIIAVSDAGCRLDQQWLEKISRPLANENADVVVGNFRPLVKNVFQKCLAVYSGRLAELPSSRSIAFRKPAWQAIGGYPKELDYCEDLVFAQRLKKAGFKFSRAPQAVVYWPQRENLLQAAQQFFHYAVGDGQALFWPHLQKIGLVFLRYFLGFWLLFRVWSDALLVLGVYFLWAIAKNYHRVKDYRALIYLPVLQIIADLAVMAGAFWGIIKRR